MMRRTQEKTPHTLLVDARLSRRIIPIPGPLLQRQFC